MKTAYRQLAREALARAQTHLQSAEPHRYRYAALELRMSIEALTYDRARAYEQEIPPSEVDKWQPKKLMDVLIEIEPLADQSGTVSFARESSPGVPAEPMRVLGHERVFGMQAIRKHYDALGSFVHIPTMRQAQLPTDFEKMKARVNEIASMVSDALASKIFNFTLGSFARMDCENCGKPVRKRIPRDATSVIAQCFHCVASYLLVPSEDNKVSWRTLNQPLACATEGCGHVHSVWDSQIALGFHLTCPSCGAQDEIQPTVARTSQPTKAPTNVRLDT